MDAERRNAALAHGLAKARAAGADDVEISYCGLETQFTRFASSRFTQVGSSWDDAVRIRTLVDGRLGAQVCASLDHDRLGVAAADAVAAARLSPTLDVALAFAAGAGDDEPIASPRPALPSELSATGAPAVLARAFAPHRTRGVTFAGAIKTRQHVFAVRTAAGLARDFENASAEAHLIALLEDSSSGYAGACGGAGSVCFDLESLAKRAADTALRSRGAIELEPGAYDAVLAPAAIAEVLEWMAEVSFPATSIIEGASLLCDRQGKPLCDPAITIEDRIGPDDAPFDAEGTPRAPVTFIDAGRGGSPLTCLVTAARLGDPRGSTGHAPAVTDEWSLGPSPCHLRMHAGDKTEEELIASVDRGLYVTRLHYVNGLLDPRNATTTGMTRDGTFLIKGGRLGPAVRNMRFTEPMLEAFSRLGGLGSEVRDVPTWWTEAGTISVPAMLIPGFHFTGKSR